MKLIFILFSKKVSISTEKVKKVSSLTSSLQLLKRIDIIEVLANAMHSGRSGGILA